MDRKPTVAQTVDNLPKMSESMRKLINQKKQISSN
jgi:hypothetical protein